MTQVLTHEPIVAGDTVQYKYTNQFTYKVERIVSVNGCLEMFQIKPSRACTPTYANQDDIKKVRH